ncbi:unnamed protein product, partial [Didymodactylos carnosus]
DSSGSTATTSTCLPQQIRFRTTANLETYLLVWLDKDVHTTEGNLVVQRKLRRAVNEIIMFENCDECVDYIKALKTDQKLVFIVSESFGREAVPILHDFRTVTSIFVYCTKKESKKKWLKQFAKVKGVFTQLDELVLEVTKAQRIQERIDDDSVGITIYRRSTGDDIKSANATFQWFQLFLDNLLEMSNSSRGTGSRQELIDVCKQVYKGNDYELSNLEEFELDYDPESAILWYSRDFCFYRILKKALRDNNFDVIFALRSFICDLVDQLELQHGKLKFLTYYVGDRILRFYRVQGILTEELNLLRASVGEYVSFKNFLVTTTVKSNAISSLKQLIITPEYCRILYQFNIDTGYPNKKWFAPIKHFSSFECAEGEMLNMFMLGTIFRIGQFEFNTQEQMWIVTLSLCSADDSELKNLMTQTEKKESSNGLVSLGYFLYAQHDFEKAKNYLLKLLNEAELLDASDTASCYRALALIAMEWNDYDEALMYFQRDALVWMKLGVNENRALSYRLIADLYNANNDYNLAFEYANKALDLLPNNSVHRAGAYEIIGKFYKDHNQLQISLDWFEKSLDIQRRLLPENHPGIGTTYNKTASIFVAMKNYEKAVEYSSKSLLVFRNSLPANHPRIQGVAKCLAALLQYLNENPQERK